MSVGTGQEFHNNLENALNDLGPVYRKIQDVVSEIPLSENGRIQVSRSAIKRLREIVIENKSGAYNESDEEKNDGQTEFVTLSVADQSRATIPSADGKGITLSLQIDDLQMTHGEFIKDGLSPTEIRSNVMEADVFYLFDPVGTRIEFWSPV